MFERFCLKLVMLLLMLLMLCLAPSATSQLISLGCYEPFGEPGISSSTDSVASLSKCNCNTATQLLFVRGGQCVCIDNADLDMNRVDESYCDIPCRDQPEMSCGGNFGASVYCESANRESSTCSDLLNNSPSVSSDVYPQFDNFEDVAHCMNLGCGMPEFASSKYIVEYFPNLTPRDCVVFCIYRQSAHAHLGWKGNSTGKH